MATIKDITDSLKMLEAEVKRAHTSTAELQGREKEILSRLKAEFGVNNVDEARVLLAKKEAECKGLETKISKQFEELKNAYEW